MQSPRRVLAVASTRAALPPHQVGAERAQQGKPREELKIKKIRAMEELTRRIELIVERIRKEKARAEVQRKRAELEEMLKNSPRR